MPQKGDSAAWCGCQGDGPDKSQALHRTKASFSFKVYCNRKPCVNSQTTHILDRYSPALGSPSSSVKGPRETLFTSAKSNSLSCFKTNLVWFFHSFALLTPHTPLLPGARTIASFLPHLPRKLPPKSAAEELSRTWPPLLRPGQDTVSSPTQTVEMIHWSFCPAGCPTIFPPLPLIFHHCTGNALFSTPADGQGVKLNSFACAGKLNCLVLNMCLFLLI